MKKNFFCIDAHTCGNPVRLVTGGGPILKGDNMSEKRQHFLKEYNWIRKGLMFEPRGHDMMSGSILYPLHNPDNDVAVLFIETSGCLPMCGIFIVSADITHAVGSAGWLILLWILTGVLTLIAALSYGELSAMFPKAGGQYVYLKEAYNRLTGFYSAGVFLLSYRPVPWLMLVFHSASLQLICFLR